MNYTAKNNLTSYSIKNYKFSNNDTKRSGILLICWEATDGVPEKRTDSTELLIVKTCKYVFISNGISVIAV